VLFAAIAVLVQLTVDPYDTGRFALFGDHGVPPFGQRLTAASLARRQDVQGATLGNSTIQHLDPVRLGELTGFPFVSLALAATGPIEQLAVARWLIRHHDGKRGAVLRALVIDIDTRWCRGDGTIELTNPFPFWLYSGSRLTYATNLVGFGTFGAVGKKLKLMLHLGHTQALRPDGYREYDSDWPWNTAIDLRKGMEDFHLFGENFAGAARLSAFLPELPPETVVILFFPPRYYAAIPAPDTIDTEQNAACKNTYRDIAATRPRTVVLDFLKDDPLLHVDKYFLDRAHYLRPITDKVEDAIAATIKTTTGGLTAEDRR
jgi:hypothetical protein